MKANVVQYVNVWMNSVAYPLMRAVQTFIKVLRR